MELTIPDQLPQLAQGSWSAESGKACIMNAISYINGDKQISDMPDCVFKPLSHLAQTLNDTICQEGACIPEQYDAALLCPAHSHQMWLLGARLIGTGEAVRGMGHWERSRLAVQLAVFGMVRLNPQDAEIVKTLATVQQWLDGEVNARAVRKAGPKDLTCNHTGDTSPEHHELCGLAKSLVRAVAYCNGSSADRTGFASSALQWTLRCTADDKLAFIYAVLAEFDRITGKESLHQWTEDEFTLVHDLARVPLITVS